MIVLALALAPTLGSRVAEHDKVNANASVVLFGNDKCVSTVCLERGHRDRDCCGFPDRTSCKFGYVKQPGTEVCFRNGRGDRDRTCCKPDPELAKCVPAACKERGHHDKDCCGRPDKTSCADGYIKVDDEKSLCFAKNRFYTCCVQDGKQAIPEPDWMTNAYESEDAGCPDVENETCCMCMRRYPGQIVWQAPEDYSRFESDGRTGLGHCLRECKMVCRRIGFAYAGCWGHHRMEKFRRDLGTSSDWIAPNFTSGKRCDLCALVAHAKSWCFRWFFFASGVIFLLLR